MLEEVRAGNARLSEKVDAYRDEAAILHSKLDLHIATCDLRYAAAQKAVREHTPFAVPVQKGSDQESALFSKQRLFKRMVDGVVEHLGLIVVLTVINMVFFAWTHGFRQVVTL